MSQATPDILTGANFPGGTGIQAIEDALKANGSTHSGATAPSYKVLGTSWYDSANEEYKMWDGSAWVVVAGVTGYKTLLVNDATPSVLGGTSFKTANTAPTTILALDDGAAGQIVTIRAHDTNTTLGTALTGTGMVIPLWMHDVVQLQCNGSASWKQIGGSVGMGRFVPVDPADAIGDWISETVVAYADVDVSDDNVRKGACAVLVQARQNYDNTTPASCYARPNGSSDAGNGRIVIRPPRIGPVAGDLQTGVFIVGLDNNAVFEAYFTAANQFSTNEAYVLGYWI